MTHEQKLLVWLIYIGIAFIVAVTCTAVWMNDESWAENDDMVPPAVAGVFAGLAWPLGSVILPFLLVHWIAKLVNTPARRRKEQA